MHWQINNLAGVPPKDVMINHGPTKLLLDNFHWHSPNAGIVASYTPKARDVEDHFGIFRGVDQIESFAQAAVGACNVFLECSKLGYDPIELSKNFIPRFISVGNVVFHSFLEEGDTFVSIGQIKFYKFRQMVSDGRIYKVPKGLNLDDYFRDYKESQLLSYELNEAFTLIAEFQDITGRSLKKVK